MVSLCLAFCYLCGILYNPAVLTKIETPVYLSPHWFFTTGWFISFTSIGLASGLVWSTINTQKGVVKKALLFFFVQLLLTALWFLLFFTLTNLFLATIELFLLFLLVYETYYLFKKCNNNAGKFLLLHLIWVGFVGITTLYIYIKNL